MTNKFTLIYKTFNFAESKALDFETRNVFKKYKLHAQYMTQRKMKTLASVDEQYNSLLNIHQTLAHAGFVIFVMPTEEAIYNTIEELNQLICELKKETLIENEDFQFVGLVYNGVCITHAQLQKILEISAEDNKKSIFQLLQNATGVLTYTLHKHITPTAQQLKSQTVKLLAIKQIQKVYI